MRKTSDFIIRLARGTIAAAALAGGLAGPAVAGGYGDRISADSFGNLIIYSAAGYKRIVVGQGHLAQELAAYSHAGSADVVYMDDAEAGYAEPVRCRPQGVLLHGRSYMYGLPDGVVPVLEHPCR
jgi:hypothetical protein